MTDLNRHHASRSDYHLSVARKYGAEELADHFGKYAGYDKISAAMAHYDIFRKIVDVQGCIIECGVRAGDSLMLWLHLSNLLDDRPRHIYGFDTFEGFPDGSITESVDIWPKVGDSVDGTYDSLLSALNYVDNNHRVSVIKGDFLQTGQRFLDGCDRLRIALLFLNFDLYAPTKEAIKLFLPYLAPDGFLVCTEINNHLWPGANQAIAEEIGFRNLRIERIPCDILFNTAQVSRR